jgi:hypothetical protein
MPKSGGGGMHVLFPRAPFPTALSSPQHSPTLFLFDIVEEEYLHTQVRFVGGGGG